MKPIIQENCDCILQCLRFLEELDGDLYIRPCAACYEGRIGEHIRHNIDHYLSLLNGYETGRIDYDDRKRDPSIEFDRTIASEIMLGILDRLKTINEIDLDRPVQVKLESGMEDAADSWSESTVRRELQFLISHSIHHYALIARPHSKSLSSGRFKVLRHGRTSLWLAGFGF